MFLEQELRDKVEELKPWHYCHEFPYGIMTGTCIKETVHPKLVRLIAAGAFPRASYPEVLDLGANSGINSMWFCDHKQSHVTAIDYGPKYYPQLELAIQAKGYVSQITPVYADIREADFGEELYDLILFLGTMHHVKRESHRPIFEACYRALRPGGRLVAQTKIGSPVLNLMKAAKFGKLKKLYTNARAERAAWCGDKDVDDEQTLLDALGISTMTEDMFRLRVVEALGYLVVLSHWLRGRLNWLTHTKAVEFSDDVQRDRWRRMDASGDAHEEFIWELAVPRAMLPIIREWRETGKLPEDFETMLKSDVLGRFIS